MPDVKIGIEAEVSNVDTSSLEQEIEKTSRRLGARRWNPIDLEATTRDLKRLEELIADFHKRVGTLAISVGVPPEGVLPGKPAAPRPQTTVPSQPAPAGTTQQSGGAPAARTSRRRGPGAYTHMPTGWSVPQHLISGLGGGFGQIAGYGTRGAMAGAYQAGLDGGGRMERFGGGAFGLLRGLGIGAAAFGALKLGQSVHEGYELAKERAFTLDSLKRQMGDLGVSFNVLKVAVENAANSLELNSKEAAAFAAELNRLRRGLATPVELADQTRTAVGISRAYGLDPGVGVQFIGRLLNIDPRQNNRELALLIAEAIQRGGFANQAALFMQAVESFAAATSRLSLAAPNIAGYADAFAAMMEPKAPGLTAEVTAGILSQASATIARMGGAGEASWHFTLAAFNRAGPKLDPILARALAEGGLFATRESIFGAEDGRPRTMLGRYYAEHDIDVSELVGDRGNLTNLEAIVRHFERMGGPASLKLEAFQRHFGLASLSQAAALWMLGRSPGQAGNLQRLLERAGVDIGMVNETGIQTLAEVAGAATREDLDRIATELLGRTGKGAPSDEQRAAIRAAQESGDTETLRVELVRIAATLDRQETEASRMIDAIKSIEETQIKYGDKLVTPINAIRSAVAFIAGQGKMGPEELARRIAEAASQERIAGIKAAAKARENNIAPSLLAHEQALDRVRSSLQGWSHSPEKREALLREYAGLYELARSEREELARIREERDAQLVAEQERFEAELRALVAELKGEASKPPGETPENDSGASVAPSEAAPIDPGIRPAASFERGTGDESDRREPPTDNVQARREVASIDPGMRPEASPESASADTGVGRVIRPPVLLSRPEATPDQLQEPRASTVPDDLFQRVLQMESGRRHTDDSGRLIESAAGARGIAQIMPATGKNPGYGVRPLQNDSEAEHLRFARDYLGAMGEKYRGDWAKAVAAYNAGPGAVDAAIRRAGENWIAALPAETRRYVPAVLGEDRPTPLPERAVAFEQRRSVQDTVNLNVNVSGRFDGPAGQVLTPSVSTVVSVPRGAGVRSASVAAG